MNILEGLNEAQKSAVTASDGPLLILAGAGSGKTKTLTHRIAYLIHEKGVWPTQILAVTFTNKAAKEMRDRLWTLIEDVEGNGFAPRNFMPWMGTFHGICVRLLRQDGPAIDVPSNFIIYDEEDRQALIKQAMRQLGISDSSLKPRAVSSAISSAKNEMIGPAEFASGANYPFQQNVAKIYAEYEKQRKNAKALDFDDLLLETVHLLQEVPAIREKWQKQFQQIF